MTGVLEDTLLRLNNVTEQQIADINRVMPDIQNLILVAITHKAQVNRVLDVLLPVAKEIIAKQRELK